MRIPVDFFGGSFLNTNYTAEEAPREPTEFVINDKVFLIGHGDGLGPGDYSYKLMKKVFTNRFFKWCFKLIHPDIGIRIGQFLSKENKVMSTKKDAKFINNESEWLTQYCRKKLPYI